MTKTFTSQVAPGIGIAIDPDGTVRATSVPVSANFLSNPNSNVLFGGKFWQAVNAQNGVVANTQQFYNAYTVNGAATPFQKSSFFPTYIQWKSVNSGTGGAPSYGYGQASVRFRYYGNHLNMQLLGQPSSQFMVKVNGTYITPLPQDVPNDGNAYYYDIYFQQVDWYDVEFILSGGAYFAGIWTGATDAVTPVSRHKKKIAVIGDSYTWGSGANALCTGYVRRLMDRLGWDNYLVNGVGGTGLLSTNGGGSLKYRGRMATDIYPYAPDVILVQGSLNDTTIGASAASLATELAALVTDINGHLSSPLIIFVAAPTAFGPTVTPNLAWTQKDACKTQAIASGAKFIDLMERPLPSEYSALTHTLGASAGIGVSSLTINGNAPERDGVYKFADGTRCRMVSVAGAGAPYTCITEASGLQTAQTNGATLTRVGQCPWTGTGYSGHPAGDGDCDFLISADRIHPTQAGHNMIGDLIYDDIQSYLS